MSDGRDTTTGDVAIERTVAAPVDLVWRMWTDAEHFASWYGPQGATVPTIDLDVRVGGRRHFCMQMQTPDGEMTMWFCGEFTEIIEGERLVYTESMSDETGAVVAPEDLGMPSGHPTVTTVTVELTDLGGTTRMVMTHAGVPSDSPGATGWEMALDKLEASLTS